jgi:hypothetical protein
MYKLINGDIYNPNNPLHRICEVIGRCYVDRSREPPVIIVLDDNEYEILGWVWFRGDGLIKVKNVDVELTPDKRHFIYRGHVYEPGLYFLIKREGHIGLVSDDFLAMFEDKPLNALIEAKSRS